MWMPILNIQAYYKIKLSFTFSIYHIITQQFQNKILIIFLILPGRSQQD
jgi:hypothetical protein